MIKFFPFLSVALFFVLSAVANATIFASFLSEDQGAHLSHVGTPGLQTPNIDALAKRGTYFNNAFVVYSVCSASKAAMYTGLHAHTNGILNNTHNFHKPANQVTAAEKDRVEI